MELILQNNIEHQLRPVMEVVNIVQTSDIDAASASHKNPKLRNTLNSNSLANAWKTNRIPSKFQHYETAPNNYHTKIKDLPAYQMMDVKMETGTGKTYVYTQTIYELHKRCGYNKFIIAVPTLPIKAGTNSFLADPYVQRHFSDTCGYRTQIELCLLEPQKLKKKGRLNFPASVTSFYNGSRYERNKIYVLLLNTQLLTSGKLLTREDYDQILGEFHRPADAISDTHPVLIIDEPHRMTRDSKSFTSLITTFRPQLVLRYGATYPDITIGKDKNRRIEKDYVNLIYDLNACAAFEQTLIKGVAKEHLEIPGGKSIDKKVKITNIVSKESVNFQYITSAGAVHRELCAGDGLGVIDGDLSGITIDGITANSILLSNGQEKFTGEEFFPDQYAASYQEGMLALALKRHFETERYNFERKPTRIKTLALFFIDNIESYRGTNGNNDGWLHLKFIDLLRSRVEEELKCNNSPGYTAYLQATLNDLEGSCAGYFAQDNQDSDEAIAREVKDILHGKKELLSFTNKEGKINVRRFLFSKWTLKEGWDNPNIFTICKLRSSGSEISKLQEVGRGLRLPVDEAGNRIVDKTFMLNYIVDFTEKDFATKLVTEINKDTPEETRPLQITSSDICRVAKLRGISDKLFLVELIQQDFLDWDTQSIRMDKFDEVLTLYPEFNNGRGVDTNRIINHNCGRKETVGIRKARFEELRNLWNRLNSKYILYFDEKIDDALAVALPSILKKEKIFSLQVVSTDRSQIIIETGKAVNVDAASTQLILSDRYLPYNEFLRRASKHTFLPLKVLHDAICKVANNEMAKITTEMFNENSLTRFISAVNDWKMQELQGLVRYKQANYLQQETKLTNADGSVKEEVAQTFIGRKREKDVILPQNYLYSELVYDSEIERDNITQSDIDEIIVYGKIPSSSICIPTVASSNYSPDFMYVVKKKDGSKELNIIIESKGYDNKSSLSLDEPVKMNCAENFFKEMRSNGFNIHFREQINSTKIKKIIEELITE